MTVELPIMETQSPGLGKLDHIPEATFDMTDKLNGGILSTREDSALW